MAFNERLEDREAQPYGRHRALTAKSHGGDGPGKDEGKYGREVVCPGEVIVVAMGEVA